MNIIERRFWLVIGSAAVFGLLLPGITGPATQYIMPNLQYLVMAMLFTVFIRVDLFEMLHELKNPGFLAYVSICFLVIIPAVMYFLVLPFGRDIATAVLIISAVPVGASAGTLARLIGGNPTLGASLTIVTSLLAPFSIPLVLQTLTGATVNINRLSLLTTLVATLFIPMLVSQIVLKWLKPIGELIKPRAPAINILLLFFVVFVAITANRDVLISHPQGLIGQTLILFGVFILLHIVGYAIAPGRSKSDRLALATSLAYMNLGLAVIIAAKYYGPTVLVPVVLAHLPWSTLLIPFKRVALRL